MTTGLPIGRRAVIGGLAALPLAQALAGCAPLAIIDTLVPKDGGATLEARDIAYGPHPRHRLDVYRPDRKAPGAPVVVFVYGGSWNSGSKDDYSFAGRALASRGYTTVVFDYRLVPEIRFPAFIDDCAVAIRWTHDHIAAHGGDPRRIALVGHSAGAYNAAMAALDPHYLAAVGLGRRTLRAAALLSGPYDFLPLDADATIAAFSSAPDLARTQPIRFVRPDAPPMLLATGDADDLVYPRNTYALAGKLRQAGATVEQKTYKGIGHPGILLALSLPFRDRAPVLDDIDAFLRAHA